MAIKKPDNKSVKSRYVGMISKNISELKGFVGADNKALNDLAKNVSEIILTYMYSDSTTDRKEMAENMLNVD